MKSIFKTLLPAALVALLVGFLAYKFHPNAAPNADHSLDFYPEQIRAFLTGNTPDAPALRAASRAADDTLAAAANRLKNAPPHGNEFAAARRDYLQAGLAKLDHVRRVADAYDNHAARTLDTAAPAPTTAPTPAPETGLLARLFAAIAAYSATKFALIAALVSAALMLLLRFLRAPAKPATATDTFFTAPDTATTPAPKPPPNTAPSYRPHPAALRPFQLPLNKNVTLDMLPVRAGTYTLGEGDKAFPVAIPHPFWLGKYEVTQAQWKAVMGANNNPSKHPGDRLPVENISHAAVAEFCQRINQAETAAGRLPSGYAYALPTEDEWCYAACAGDPLSTATGWTADNSGGNTHNVGELPPNAWGFHDMVGNVSEMCADIAVGNLSGGSGTTLRSLRDKHRITRGGDIAKRKNETNHTYRDALVENATAPEVGFRLALRKTTT